MWLFGAFATNPPGFSVVTPIQILSAAGTVVHKFPIQKILASGTSVVYVFLVPGKEYNDFVHFHRNTVRQQQLKANRKISQSAGPFPLSD
jgi:hypothetical protein